jgi:hypothetical protein
MADLAIASSFLKALGENPQAPIRLRFIHDTRKHEPGLTTEHVGTLEALWPAVLRAQAEGFGIFYFLNVVGDIGEDEFATDRDVTFVRAVAADFDHGLPEPWQYHSPPDLIVHTSAGKGQAIWCEVALPLEDFKPVSKRLIALYDSDKAVQNLSRVLRLPGTMHLKGEPQLVTFEDHSAETINTSVLDNLPKLPPVHVSSAAGIPVPLAHVEALLKHVDPDVEYPAWRDIVAGIRNSPVIGDDDESKREDLALRWSRGELWTKSVSRYDGDDAVVRVFDTMPPKEGGAGFGTVYHAAVANGYMGSSAPVDVGSVAFAGVSAPVSEHERSPEWTYVRDTIKRVVPPVEELVEGLIEKGIVTFLSGPGGTNKSRLMMAVGLALNAGIDALNRKSQQATLVYISYEDHPDEVTRRQQKILKRLKIEPGDAQWINLTGRPRPLAVIGDDVILQDFYKETIDHVGAIPGHKLIVLDSTYNGLHFIGNAKVNEGAVQGGIGVLQSICDETNSTMVPLWHPSQAGQERGDGSGWSVAWHNVPRARLTINAMKNTRDLYELNVAKRNNGPKPSVGMILRWADGILVPASAVEGTEGEKAIMDAVVRQAIAAAEGGAPIQRLKKPEDWVYDTIALQTGGYRPTQHELKERLSKAAREGRLTYLNDKHQSKPAGYYAGLTPFAEEPKEDWTAEVDNAPEGNA